MVVEINPETARELGLKEGKYADLTHSEGKSESESPSLRRHQNPALPAMPRGLGHTAYDDLPGWKGIEC